MKTVQLVSRLDLAIRLYPHYSRKQALYSTKRWGLNLGIVAKKIGGRAHYTPDDATLIEAAVAAYRRQSGRSVDLEPEDRRDPEDW